MSIELILGPMFSGKTTELLRRIAREYRANRQVLLVKYSKDDRYSSDSVASHDRLMMEDILTISCSNLHPIVSFVEKFKNTEHEPIVIGIDEGQFFPDLIEFCEKMAQLGKEIHVAALDGTFERKPFPVIADLIPRSNNFIKLNAVCFRCKKDAPFSKRLGQDKKLEVIGGADKYESRCRECFDIPDQSPQQRIPRIKITTT